MGAYLPEIVIFGVNMHPSLHPPLFNFLLDRWQSFTALVPITIAIVKYRNLARPLKVILAFLSFSFALILLNIYCAYHATSNLVVFHFYAIFEFGFVLWFYSYYVDSILRKLIVPLVGIFAVWSIVNFLFIQNGQLNTYTRSVESIFIIIYSIAFFSKDARADETVRWGAVSYNWVTAAFLVFYTSSFFIFIFSNYFLTRGDKLSLYFWKGYSYILVIENLLLAVGFYKIKMSTLTKTAV